MTSIPYHSRDLLAQAAWMRDLARSLLADPAAAEDVVQEAWIAALEHPPLADRPLEPWLARVVRNFAWKRRRAEARRSVHERQADSAEPVPGPEATAERLELQRTILAAVEAIPEPFRTVVVERYFQGRSSADIARALSLPEGTVRWRLKRGLDELRRRLDARFGRREAWCALLGPLALAPNGAGASSAAGNGTLTPFALKPGVLAMVGTSKIVLAATLGMVALGFLLWRDDEAQRGGRGEALLAHAAPVAEPALAPASTTAPLALTEQREARTTSPQASAPPPVSMPAVETEAPTQALLTMRFVDAHGIPWSDVDVVQRWLETTKGTSGPDGRVEILLTADENWSEWTEALFVRRSGCTTRLLQAVLTAGRKTDLGDVLLERGSRIEGRILDEAGVAIEGAEVGRAPLEPLDKEFDDKEFDQQDEEIGADTPADEGLARRHGASGFERMQTTKSDPAGAFVLDGTAAGQWRLWAHAPGTRYGWTEPFDVPVGKDVFGIEVRLPALLPGDHITGIVLDPVGKPFPDARLIAAYRAPSESSSTTLNVGADGRFDLVLRREVAHSFVASDPEQRYAIAIVTEVAPGARNVELRLGEKRRFEVAVQDSEGLAIESCRFVLGVRVEGATANDGSPPSIVEPGLYELALPAIPFHLEVEADGFLPARFESLRPEAVGSRFEVVLGRAPRLHGRVVAEGKSVARARVSLHRAVLGRGYWRNDFVCLYEADTIKEVTCDSEGRFELACEGTEGVWLRASSPGWAVGDLGPLDPLSTAELTLELTAGGSIEGRVLLPNGADAQGIVVGLNHGDGQGRTLRVGPQGRFRFDHLAPGRWQVLRREAELDLSTTTVATSQEPVEIDWNCTVAAGRTTHFDLDLSRP